MTGPSSVPRGERTPRAAGRLAVAWCGEHLDTTAPGGNEPAPARLNRRERRALARAARRRTAAEQQPRHVGGDPEFCPACRAMPSGPAFPQCPGPERSSR